MERKNILVITILHYSNINSHIKFRNKVLFQLKVQDKISKKKKRQNNNNKTTVVNELVSAWWEGKKNVEGTDQLMIQCKANHVSNMVTNEKGSLEFIDDVTADRSRKMSSEA